MNVSLYQAASALNASSRWQDVIAENLASSSVPGYRKQEISFASTTDGSRASDVRSPGGTDRLALPESQITRNFQQGEMKYTGAPTHVGIHGRAFFEVQLPDGTTAYTRDGEFQISAEGQLVTKQGYPILGDGGPITVELDRPEPITISATGEVSQGSDLRGRIKLTAFEDEQLLTGTGGGFFLSTDPRINQDPADTSTVRQGWLEGSNTSVVSEMANLISAMRTFEAAQRVVQLHDDQMNKAINTLGNNV